MKNSIIRLENISKTYGDTKVLNELNLSIKKNEFLTLLGPSGCGKTTMLNIIGGLDKMTSGEIVIDVPGITRAYRDLHISPKNSKHLTIPLHRSAYGKRATEFSDLFVVTKKNGKKFLA